ncbi:MAG: ABC transporter ATP-binding protein [Burkholderiales bacterium]|jgi:branched-chain amino acid transport system ATP-binding protein
MSMLTIHNLTAGYDAANVVSDVSLEVIKGKITCLLGANGAGKTTLIRSILGLNTIRSGRVSFDSVDISSFATHDIASRGITCVPEGRRVFAKMTVRENLQAGAFLERNADVVAERLLQVYAFFPKLEERFDQLAGTMSGGEQAMLTIGRSLMSNPSLMIFDEPSLGLSPLFVKENFRIIKKINEKGMTVLLVEQNVRQTLAIAHYGYVLSQGKIVASGSVDALKDNSELRAAYFGNA